MSRFFKSEGASLALSGDTFSVKDLIKGLGGRWDSGKRCWVLRNTPESMEKILALGFSQLSTLVDSFPHEALATSLVPTEASGPTKVWSVSEFVNYMAGVIQTHLGFDFWLTGEITSLKSSNGHLYFELAERDNGLLSESASLRASAISCCLWAGKLGALSKRYGDLPLGEGLKVKILVHCEFKKEQSRVNVIVDDIDTRFTVGELALNRQGIVRELKKRGLYDRNRALQLAPLPLRIALITAAASRAASDFLDELKMTGLAFSIVLFDANMQGEATSANVCSAFDLLASGRHGAFDCVVLTRGGGSRLDLRWFDDIEIAKKIAYCALPVVSAIGHHDDVSVADEVSFLAEKTPTGAARYLGQKVVESASSLFTRMDHCGRKIIRRMAEEHQKLARLEESLQAAVRRRLIAERNKLSSCEQAIRLLSLTLERTLHRGFALLKNENGRILKAADFLALAETMGTEPHAGKFFVEMLDPASSTEVTLTIQVVSIEKQSPDSP